MSINRSYLVYRNGLLYTRTLTLAKAKKIIIELRNAGFTASLAESLEG